MRNPRLETLEWLIGRWTLTLSGAWFFEPGTELHGWATFEWLGDSFVVLRSQLGAHPGYSLAIGHNDAHSTHVALYHDERGVSRLFQMTFDEVSWTMSREDPDFHQRFLAEFRNGAIEGRWEASDDGGHTWRKDFDLVFARGTGQS